MPGYRKKTYRKKRKTKKPIVRIQRRIGMKPATHFFTRKQQFAIDCNDSGTFPSNMGYTTEGNIYWNTAFALSSLDNHTEFTNLFTQYKICAIKLEISPHINVTNSNVAENLMIRTKWNSTGREFTSALTNSDILQMSAMRKYILPRANNKPAQVYFKTRQLNMIYETNILTGYSTVKPRYIDTKEPDVPHQGLMMYISATSGNTFTQLVGAPTVPKLNIIATYYIACKAVM